MKLETLKLSELNPAEYNPRTITKEEFEGLKQSLKTFGQQENLIVNKDMTVIEYKLMKCYNSIMSSKDYWYNRWRNDPELRAMNRVYKHKARFGFDVDSYREAGVCAECGITNKQCKDKYSKSLSVDHINNNGRSKYAKELDNRIENLQLLCQSCHTRKTNKVDSYHKYKDPQRMKKHWATRQSNHPQLRVIDSGKKITIREYAEKHNISRGYAYILVKEGKLNAEKSTN